jgi:ABC-type sugar transport system permease subunit
MGYAAAAAWLLTLMLLACALAYIRLVFRR